MQHKSAASCQVRQFSFWWIWGKSNKQALCSQWTVSKISQLFSCAFAWAECLAGQAEVSFLAVGVLGRSSFSSAGMGCRRRSASQRSCRERSMPAWVLGWENVRFWASLSTLAAVECFPQRSHWVVRSCGSLEGDCQLDPSAVVYYEIIAQLRMTQMPGEASAASASLQITSAALLWTPSLIFGDTRLLTPASWEQLCLLEALRGGPTAPGQLPTVCDAVGLEPAPGWAADPSVLWMKCERCVCIIAVCSIPLPGNCDDPNSTWKKIIIKIMH